jgi:hypothetical protein
LPKRRLLAGEPCQLGLGLVTLGHVARERVHDALLDDGRGRPLEHPVGAVLAQVTVLERQRRRALGDRDRLGCRPHAVVRMDELEVRA